MILISAESFASKGWRKPQNTGVSVSVQCERMIEQDSAQVIDAARPYEAASSLTVITFVGAKLLGDISVQLVFSGSVHRLETHQKATGLGKVAAVVPDWHSDLVTPEKGLHAPNHQGAHQNKPGKSIDARSGLEIGEIAQRC
jgi:hypothetical protein